MLGRGTLTITGKGVDGIQSGKYVGHFLSFRKPKQCYLIASRIPPDQEESQQIEKQRAEREEAMGAQKTAKCQKVEEKKKHRRTSQKSEARGSQQSKQKKKASEAKPASKERQAMHRVR